MGGVPTKVVHLTAADEYRENFSLTNINSTLKTGKSLELSLPRVHSDVWGSYTEAGQGELNLEVRRIHNEAEKRRLIAEGWYTDGSLGPNGKPTPNQFVPWGPHTPAVDSHTISAFGHTIKTPSFNTHSPSGENGVRSLTTDYQFVTLAIMHDFAKRIGGMDLAAFEERQFAAYRVPTPLVSLGARFLAQAQALDGSRIRRPLKCQSDAETRWLRNHYLHRSARSLSEITEIGMSGREDMSGRTDHTRLVIPDDDLNFVPPSLRGVPEPETDYTGL